MLDSLPLKSRSFASSQPFFHFLRQQMSHQDGNLSHKKLEETISYAKNIRHNSGDESTTELLDISPKVLLHCTWPKLSLSHVRLQSTNTFQGNVLRACAPMYNSFAITDRMVSFLLSRRAVHKCHHHHHHHHHQQQPSN